MLLTYDPKNNLYGQSVACKLRDVQSFQNALAYFVMIVSYASNMFMKFAPDVCV